MNMYSVVPAPKEAGWIVKLEDVAPDGQFNTKDEAIAEAEKMAQNNKPSIVEILDKDHNIVDEKRFN